MIFDSNYDLKDESETLRLAENMANHLYSGMNLYLKGELGAGKTTFVRGILRGLGYEEKVKSPTYTLVETYNLEKFTICHFDLYRFKGEHEWDDAGFREYFNKSSVCFVEWPEKARQVLPKPDISIELNYESFGRHIHLISYSSLGTKCLKAII
jgi:tRNA threonylcarbamoyladenosine biosynthesis protein TsaE